MLDPWNTKRSGPIQRRQLRLPKMLRNAITSHLRDIRAALGGVLKSECWTASIEGDGGLRLEYPNGCLGIYGRILEDWRLSSGNGPPQLW
jgi:hypothetical protein